MAHPSHPPHRRRSESAGLAPSDPTHLASCSGAAYPLLFATGSSVPAAANVVCE
jgi:hypothetical protein